MKSTLILVLTSIFYLLLALLPSLHIILGKDADLSSIVNVVWSGILFIPAFILSIVTYKIIVKINHLQSVSKVKLILIPLLITSLSATWAPLGSTIVQATYKAQENIFIRKTQKLELSLLEENVELLDDELGSSTYPYGRPTKYVYKYKISVVNKGIGINNIFVGAGLENLDNPELRYFFHHYLTSLPQGKTINIGRGQNIITGTLPINVADYYGGAPTKVGLRISFTEPANKVVFGYDSINMYKILESKLPNWAEIYFEQSRFEALNSGR